MLPNEENQGHSLILDLCQKSVHEDRVGSQISYFANEVYNNQQTDFTLNQKWNTAKFSNGKWEVKQF